MFCIVDAPDDEAVAAVAIAINSSGAPSMRTTELLTVEQVDEALGARWTTSRPAPERAGAGSRLARRSTSEKESPPLHAESLHEAPALCRGGCRVTGEGAERSR